MRLCSPYSMKSSQQRTPRHCSPEHDPLTAARIGRHFSRRAPFAQRNSLPAILYDNSASRNLIPFNRPTARAPNRSDVTRVSAGHRLSALPAAQAEPRPPSGPNSRVCSRECSRQSPEPHPLHWWPLPQRPLGFIVITERYEEPLFQRAILSTEMLRQ